MKVIKSKNFILRQYRKGDEKSLRKNINNKKVSQYTSNIPYPYTQKDAKFWVAKNLKEDKKKKPDELNLVIDIAGKVAGSVGFSDIIYGHKAEIGYWLAEKYWGKGITTQAVNLAVKFAFDEFKLKRIFATVFLNNKASKRVMEKAGFNLEGILKNWHKKNSKMFDSYMLAKTKS